MEGVFELPRRAARRPELATGERLPEDAEEIVLARRVSAEGRTRAYLEGRRATRRRPAGARRRAARLLRPARAPRLTLASAQLEILDGFCGPEHLGRGARTAPRLHAQARELERRAGGAARARGGARARARPARVGAAGRSRRPRRARRRRRELSAERGRLRQLEALRAAPRRRGRGAGAGRRGGRRRRALLAEAERRAGGGAGRGPELDALAERMRARCASRPRTSARELRRYAEAVEARAGPAGGGRGAARRCSTVSSASTAARSRRCSRTPSAAGRERDAAGGRRGGAGPREAELAAGEGGRWTRGAKALQRRPRRRRRRASPRRCSSELAELAMEGAAFEVSARAARRPVARGRRAGRVPDRAEPRRARPAAARDRLGRRALARDARAHGRGRTRVGPAPRSCSTRSTPASAVRPRGRWASSCARLADGRQVLCITHLPQIASLAERHFRDREGPQREDGAGAPSSGSRARAWSSELVPHAGRGRRRRAARAGTRRSCSRRPKTARVARCHRAGVDCGESASLSWPLHASPPCAASRAHGCPAWTPSARRNRGHGAPRASAPSTSSSACEPGDIAIIDHRTSTASPPRT